MDFSQLMILLAFLLGFALTWSVGANDLANIMSTTMGSKAVSVRQAMLIAVVFEFAGALFGSSDVAETIKSGIINVNAIPHGDYQFVFGMLAALMGSTLWMLIASFLGLPVSITNAIVGSIVGFGSIIFGIEAIKWTKVFYIAMSWVFAPAIAAVTSYAIFISVQRTIFDTDNPYRNAHRIIPIYLFVVGLILGDMILIKGLHHFHLHLALKNIALILVVFAIFITGIGKVLLKIVSNTKEVDAGDRFFLIERMFAVLMAFTACAMVFAHGSNDVAIAVGPMAAVVHNLQQTSQASWTFAFVERVAIPFGCVGVLVGLFMYGRKVIATVGSGITALTPSRAFAATLAAAAILVVSTSTGIPLSATQTLVGAVLGVGLARGIGALNLAVVRNIFMSWVFTIPAASLFTIIFFSFFAHIFAKS